jgi:hypothetical protein
VDNFSKWQAIITLLLAVGAIIVTFWSPSTFLWKLIIVFLFVVLGIVTVWLQEQKEKCDAASSEATRKELLNWQRGDPDNPPFIGIMTSLGMTGNGPLTIDFTMENESRFPAYDVSVRLWDVDAVASVKITEPTPPPIAEQRLEPIPPQTVTKIGSVIIPIEVSRKRFAARYSVRGR